MAKLLTVKLMQELMRRGESRLGAPRHKQKAYADQNRVEAEFQVEHRVLLSIIYLEFKSTAKRNFLPKFIASFKVACEVDSPYSCKFQDVRVPQ